MRREFFYFFLKKKNRTSFFFPPFQKTILMLRLHAEEAHDGEPPSVEFPPCVTGHAGIPGKYVPRLLPLEPSDVIQHLPRAMLDEEYDPLCALRRDARLVYGLTTRDIQVATGMKSNAISNVLSGVLEKIKELYGSDFKMDAVWPWTKVEVDRRSADCHHKAGKKNMRARVVPAFLFPFLAATQLFPRRDEVLEAVKRFERDLDSFCSTRPGSRYYHEARSQLGANLSCVVQGKREIAIGRLMQEIKKLRTEQASQKRRIEALEEEKKHKHKRRRSNAGKDRGISREENPL